MARDDSPSAARSPNARARTSRTGATDGTAALDRLAAVAAARVAGLDWAAVGAALDERGLARAGTVLTADEAAATAALFDDSARFRSTVVMPRHGYGEGVYRYFDYPLPAAVAALRAAFYERLAPVANRWQAALGEVDRGAGAYPAALADYLARCRAAGQARATPLLLSYEAGGYNRLHQDLYGTEAFPLQVAIALDRPGVDYDGGALLVVEQSPRRQSRGEAIVPAQGEAVVFATRVRPARGRRGVYRAQLRHGVATVTRGRRRTLGLIFHDAA